MEESGRKLKIAIVAATELTVTAFLQKHIVAMHKVFDVTVITNTRNPFFLAQRAILARVVPCALARNVSLARDVACLFRLFRIFRVQRADMIFSVTPKAGLLAMLAGFFSRTPVRIHMFTGQVWVTRTGAVRALLRALDMLTARLATHILVDSPSQKRFLVSEGVIAESCSDVLEKGSICGVDGERFHPDIEARKEIRQAFDVPDHVPLLLFLGRINRDKGVLDLANAFVRLMDEGRDIHLAIVGPDEEGLVAAIRQICAEYLPRVHFVDFTSHPEKFMAAADVFCLPSYREGFGAVVIEAAAVGVPSVVSKIYGLTDAVIDGETGLLHPPGDHVVIARRLATLIDNPTLLARMGYIARQRALSDFSSVTLTKAFFSYIQSLERIAL